MKNKLENTWQPESSWGGLIAAASAKMKKSIERSLKKAGLEHLSLARIGLLNVLSHQALSQSELSQKLGYSPPSTMDFLNRLKKRGLVQVVTHPEDRRQKLWSLSVQGEKELKRAKSIVRYRGGKIDQFLQEMQVNNEELDRFKEILKAFLSYKL
ncbi:MAG: MarR family transcriptional regulator [Deltaproteobacteria bacterium]|nr:MarR family transcriptional regulator [Deltaproteobacteria bacterium]